MAIPIPTKSINAVNRFCAWLKKLIGPSKHFLIWKTWQYSARAKPFICSS